MKKFVAFISSCIRSTGLTFDTSKSLKSEFEVQHTVKISSFWLMVYEKYSEVRQHPIQNCLQNFTYRAHNLDLIEFVEYKFLFCYRTLKQQININSFQHISALFSMNTNAIMNQAIFSKHDFVWKNEDTFGQLYLSTNVVNIIA